VAGFVGLLFGRLLFFAHLLFPALGFSPLFVATVSEPPSPLRIFLFFFLLLMREDGKKKLSPFFPRRFFFPPPPPLRLSRVNDFSPSRFVSR